MKMLSQKRETEIRNRLDYIAEGIHQKKEPYKDMRWAYKTIKELLYNIHELQRGMKEGENDDIRRQPLIVDICIKPD